MKNLNDEAFYHFFKKVIAPGLNAKRVAVERIKQSQEELQIENLKNENKKG